MKTLVTLVVVAIAIGSWQSSRAEDKKKNGKTTKYYRPHPRSASKGPADPKHKTNNYDQHGWN